MAQTIRLTITSDLEKALAILRSSTYGTLNTTELIKMAIGGFAQIKKNEMSPKDIDTTSALLFDQWAKNDQSYDIDNIAHPDNLKPFQPKNHV